MATLINGNGNPAVYANQDADLIASICGDTTCISAVGSQFAATQEDANTIGLADGVIITKEGRRIQLDAGYTDLFTIPTGTAGTTSYYIIGYKLTTGSDSKQTCETFVQKMNSSSETITEDTFRGGASDVYVSVYRVVQDGLNIDSINGLLPTLSLGAQTSSSHSGSGSTVTTTLAANKTLDEVTQQMLNNDYALKSALPWHESVSVTGDGTKTYATLLTELENLVDSNKLTPNSYIVNETTYGNHIYKMCNTTDKSFVWSSANPTFAAIRILALSSHGFYEGQILASGYSGSDASSSVVGNGKKLTLYY